MGLYRRIYCPHCKKDFEYRKSGKGTACKYCQTSIKLNEKNAVYYIEYYHGNRRIREKIGFNKAVAENVLKKRELEIVENKFLDIKREKKIRFCELAQGFIERHLKVNCSSGWQRKALVNIQRLGRMFNDRYLHEITPLLIEQFKVERLKEVKPDTVNKDLACLKAMFNKAIDWGCFNEGNPVSKVRFLKSENKRLRYLEKEEIPILVEHCAGHLKPIVVIALNTGMRKGELLSLKWQDIDYRRETIQLLKTKNNKVRHIPMNNAVKDALLLIRKNPESPYVFTNRQGAMLLDVKRSFSTALKKAGIKNFRFHGLRHTFASQLVMSGVDLNTVRDLLGHSTLEMTLRYAHLSPNYKKRAVDCLHERIGVQNLLTGQNDSLSVKSVEEALSVM